MSQKVTVTLDHIKQGIRASPWYCALALAIQDAFKVKRVCVNGYEVKVGKRVLPLPEIAKEFSKDFDAHIRVSPITFTL